MPVIVSQTGTRSNSIPPRNRRSKRSLLALAGIAAIAVIFVVLSARTFLGLRSKTAQTSPGIQSFPVIPDIRLPDMPASDMRQRDAEIAADRKRESEERNRERASPVASATSESTRNPNTPTRGNGKNPPRTVQCAIIQSPVATLRTADYVHWLRFSPDGKFLMAKGRIWRAPDWRQCTVGPQGVASDESALGSDDSAFYFQGAEWSPDATVLAYKHQSKGSGYNCQVDFWRSLGNDFKLVGSKQSLKFQEIRLESWNDVLWSRDSSSLLVRAPQELVVLSKDGKTVGTINPPRKSFVENYMGGLRQAALSPDGRLVATASNNQEGVIRELRVWRLPKGEQIATLPTPGGHEMLDEALPPLIFSPDGTKLAVHYRVKGDRPTHCVKLWSTTDWQVAVTLDARDTLNPDGLIPRLFSDDSRLLVTKGGSTYENVIGVWDSSTGGIVQQIRAASVKNVLLLSDGSLIAGGHDYQEKGREHNVNVWKAETGQLLKRLSDLEITTMDATPDGRLIATGHANGTVKVWDATKTKLGQAVGE
jgi:WD40 repeat protein